MLLLSQTVTMPPFGLSVSPTKSAASSRCEERDGRRDLLRAAVAPERRLQPQRRPAGGRSCIAGRRRLDEARRDRVDADPLHDQLLRDGAREGEDARPSPRSSADSPAQPSMPQIDAMFTIEPVPRARHRPRRRARAVERPVEMDGEHAPPLVVRQADERSSGVVIGPLPTASSSCCSARGLTRSACADGGDAGVVDPDVDGAERRLGLRERGVDRRAVADVGAHGQPRRRVRRRVGRVLVHVEDRDLRAVGGEAQADRLADARAAAGNDGDLARRASWHDHRPADDLAVASRR